MQLFNIIIKDHRLRVEISHISNQVMRYKVSLKDKHFILEENLLIKSDKWKIRDQSDNVDLDKLLLILPNIIEGIQAYFKPPATYNRKSW